MISRIGGNLRLRADPAPQASQDLEQEGYAIVPGVLDSEEIAALAEEITEVYETSQADRSGDHQTQFRHGMLNRSPLSMRALSKRAILDVIEPLLGEDCHVIANTAWRNPPGHQGGPWHVDAGPHVPRAAGVPWPDEIPYPLFAIGVHLFLIDCPLEAGPTAIVPRSHRSGRLPPRDPPANLSLDGREPVLLAARAGDAAFFVSDAWHRGTAAQPGYGRFFLQAHYARRDIAQRLFTTAEVSHVTPEAAAWATTERERRLIGLHPPGFYDG